VPVWTGKAALGETVRSHAPIGADGLLIKPEAEARPAPLSLAGRITGKTPQKRESAKS
jgi:hypothetical protein